MARAKEFAPSVPLDLLVVGLGNPGAEYDGTRHNVGWEVVRLLGERGAINLGKARERAQVGKGTVEGVRLGLALPLTYVNLSGEAVRLLLKRFALEPARLVAVYDDIDLAFGRIRVKPGGGTGGHQGLNSIVSHIHTNEFPRVRVGVGRPPGRMDPAVYVLRRFTKAERIEMDLTVQDAADACISIGREGVDAAMNRFNAARD